MIPYMALARPLPRFIFLIGVAVWYRAPIDAQRVLNEAAQQLWPTLWPMISDMLPKQGEKR